MAGTSTDPPVAVPPVLSYLIAGIASIATLLVGESVISNHVEKLIVGLAGIGIPMMFVLANSLIHLAHARVQAAKVAGPHTTPRVHDYSEKPKP